jgi:hypothetical protein
MTTTWGQVGRDRRKVRMWRAVAMLAYSARDLRRGVWGDALAHGVRCRGARVCREAVDVRRLQHGWSGES